MPKDNRNFFEKKKDWSEIKDTLLGAYLKPYFQKILRTRHPVFYVDCFRVRENLTMENRVRRL